MPCVTYCTKSSPFRIAQPNPTNEYKLSFCSYCGKECHSVNGLKNHERLCKSNPDRGKTYYELTGKSNLSNRGWSKGLSKDTDNRIKNLSKSLVEAYDSGKIINHQKGKPRTNEEKEKISSTMKYKQLGGIRRGSGRGKKGWYKGYFCDSTYELVYVIYNIDNNIEFNRSDRKYTYYIDGVPHFYYPDFELSDGSLVEIKGYHTSVVDLKIKSVTDRDIIILYEKDLQYAFDWVKNHYTYDSLSDLYT